jgi:hypothetical protein
MKKARSQFYTAEATIMKNEFDRRKFMRISAMSIGAGASVLLSGHEQDGAAPGTELKIGLGSMGVDVPVR